MTTDRSAHAARIARAGDLLLFDRGGRTTAIRLPRHGGTAAVALTVLLTLWSAAAGFYIAFHDTVVAELRHGSQMAAKGYDDQIVELRTELERARTRRMVEQTGADQRLTELMRRQESLERRQNALAELTDPAAVASTSDAPDRALSYTGKPTPLDRPTSAFDGIDAPVREGAAAAPTEKLSYALDRLEAGQTATLEAVAAKVDDRRRKIEKIYDAVGLDGRELSDSRGRGGPFEPLPPHARTFEVRAEQVAADRASLATLRRGLDAVPLRSPAPGAGITSGFGARVDPFLGRPAFHAGIDFESEIGQPIRATAPGRITNAGPSGGYGLMVEIDHGRGLTTRFGHMSYISVQPGQAVRAGDIIGRVGSTGRSTGPHLHYETRIDGDAVDPIRFLKAGRALAALD